MSLLLGERGMRKKLRALIADMDDHERAEYERTIARMDATTTSARLEWAEYTIATVRHGMDCK